MLPVVPDEFDPMSPGRSSLSLTERRKTNGMRNSPKSGPKGGYDSLVEFLFALRLLDSIPKFQ